MVTTSGARFPPPPFLLVLSLQLGAAGRPVSHEDLRCDGQCSANTFNLLSFPWLLSGATILSVMVCCLPVQPILTLNF